MLADKHSSFVPEIMYNMLSGLSCCGIILLQKEEEQEGDHDHNKQTTILLLTGFIPK